MRFIYIAGLPHSGTTLLELYLNQIPNAVGVGELFRAIHKFSTNDSFTQTLSGHDRKVIEGSTFWQGVMDLSRQPDKTAAEKYVEVYKTLLSTDNVFPRDGVIIDSSKWLIGATTLMKAFPSQVTIVHNVRDVRGWTVSQLDNRKKKGLTVRSWENLRCFLRWEKSIRYMISTLRQYKDRYFLCSHDRFCLQHEKVAAELSSFLGVILPCGFSKQSEIKSLNIMSNPMRYTFSEGAKIAYDNRWLYRNDWLVPYFTMGAVRRLNRELVWTAQPENCWEASQRESRRLTRLLGDFVVKQAPREVTTPYGKRTSDGH